MQEATFLILTALADGSQHGYGILAEVAEISGGRVRLRAGTLYTALDRLRSDELIGVDREDIVDGRLRRYYRLTPGGVKRLAVEAARGVAVALWLFLAWAIGQRRDVARFTFTAFFALTTLTMLIGLAQHAAVYAPADLIAGAAIWLIALATMVLIFTRQSNTFYRQAARPPLAPAAG